MSTIVKMTIHHIQKKDDKSLLALDLLETIGN